MTKKPTDHIAIIDNYLKQSPLENNNFETAANIAFALIDHGFSLDQFVTDLETNQIRFTKNGIESTNTEIVEFVNNLIKTT